MSTAIATAPDRNRDAAEDKAIVKDEAKRLRERYLRNLRRLRNTSPSLIRSFPWEHRTGR
jgi:hypothetical protein